MVGNLRRVVDNIQEASVQVASSAGEISANARLIMQGAQGQAQAAEETSTSMEEMAASIQTVAGSAQGLASYVEETSSSITEMGASIEQVARSGGTLALPASAYEHRRGTPSIGGQVHFGLLQGDSDWVDVFQPAQGLTIRVKQYVARNRAIGISFELQRFGESSTVPLIDSSFRPDYLQMQILMFDYYFYFNRAQKRSPYLVVGGGFYRPEIVAEGVDESFGGEFTVAAGLMVFAPRAALEGSRVTVYDRDGRDLAENGLFLDLPEWGRHVFAVEGPRA